MDENTTVKQKTVSYTQFSIFAKCPRKWKLDYIDELRKYEQNINTIFGTAFHSTLQNYLKVMYEQSVKQANSIDLEEYLKVEMFNLYKEAVAKNDGVHFSNSQQLAEFYDDGVQIIKYIQKHRGAYFSSKEHKLLGIETPLTAQLKNNLGFTGFIDLIIQDQRDGTITIWDIKTSTAGWNKYQKADISKTAQLILYKEFYAKQFGVDVESIRVEYFIVRRKITENVEFTPKRVQTFSPASGKPTRNKVGKLFEQFLDNCFTQDGQYNLDGSYPAIASSACSYCAYNSNPTLCSKKERLKK
jgi:hypothetical protein